MSRDLKPRRTCLSVPGSNARMNARAATLDADHVLLDLEDATAPSEKVGARAIVVESLRSLDFGKKAVAVRVNGVDTGWCYRDVVEVVEPAGDRIDTLILPKVDSAADVFFLDRLCADRASAQLAGRADWHRSTDRIGVRAAASGRDCWLVAAPGGADLWTGRSVGEPGSGAADDWHTGP